MPFYTDQTGREIEITSTQKIISLVPSQTELLFDLGLDEEVIGITKFCVHPQNWLRTKTIVGGTKNINIEKIKSLQPTLIIANKEENVKEQIEELGKHFPVWVTDVNDLDTALRMIASIGEITGLTNTAQKVIEEIAVRFDQLSESPFNQKPMSAAFTQKPKTKNLKHNTAYLIWKDPYMTAGGDTFISNMLHHAGFQNIFANQNRYPQVTMEQLYLAGCQLLLLSSEPFPFQQKHIDELQQQLPLTKILLVDGEMFSWYGSRLLKVPHYFAQLQQKIDSLF